MGGRRRPTQHLVKSRSRSKIRFAACRCFTGPLRSASITGSSAASLSFATSAVRAQLGGNKNRHIFSTVSRLKPKTRAAARRP
jgi:hypothetical protein